MRFLLALFMLYVFSCAGELITPIPLKLDVDEAKAELGKELFFDPILSVDGTISCANCHMLDQGGDDNMAFSIGVDGNKGNISSPTVYNAVFNFVQFWNGRAKDLAEQALGPIENKLEMGHNFQYLIPQLQKTPYKEKFLQIYEDGITKENIANAIAEFEKKLITPNAPFDLYLKGDNSAISQRAKKGYELFKSKGCIACHHGRNVGGNLYNKFGLFQEAMSESLGRYEVTKDEEDMYYFKVPTLRNIAQTAPYLHDGRFATLQQVVEFMSHHQLGKDIDQEEIDQIIAFLHSLSGEIPRID